MKAYTDLEQSKKLAEILPLESANMYYKKYADGNYYAQMPWCGYIRNKKFFIEYTDKIPVWSLVALLDILPYPQLSKDKLGSGKEGWMVSVYPDNCRYDSCWHDNQVDACYEMIIKLHEQNLL